MKKNLHIEVIIQAEFHGEPTKEQYRDIVNFVHNSIYSESCIPHPKVIKLIEVHLADIDTPS